MAWPTPQEFNEAIQNTRICFFDEELRNGVVAVNNFGLPKAITGAFASVYEVTCGDQRYAVRCLLNDIPDQQIRYERLSRAICSDSLACTIDFEYQPQGIKVQDSAFPIVKMAWIQGDTLDVFLEKHHEDAQKMQQFHAEFRQMAVALRVEGFAHGDLQHGNILVGPEGLRLVDYDGMFVPSLSGMHSNELGHPNYQHPARQRDHFGPFLDNFSLWVIDTTLTCLIEDPRLYRALIRRGGESLFFLGADYRNPQNSEIFYTLETHDSPVVRDASRSLRTILECLPFNVPFLCASVPPAAELPRVLEKRAEAARLAEWAHAEAVERQAEQKARLQEQAEQARRAAELLAAQLAEEARLAAARQTPNWLDAQTKSELEVTGHQPISRPAKPRTESIESPDSLSTDGSGSPNEPSEAALTEPPPPPQFFDPTAEQYAERIIIPAARGAELSDLKIEVTSDVSPAGPHNFGSENAVFHAFDTKDRTKEYCLKFFCKDILEQIARYEQLQTAIDTVPLKAKKYLVRGKSVSQALLVNGAWFPCIQSDWCTDAVSLDVYLRTRRPDFDYTLLNRLRRMITTLQSCKIHHGSLEPSNILVLPDSELMLVDYDNMYTIPTKLFSELPQAYRHPLAAEMSYGQDYFSAWLLDTMVLCWSSAPKLWRAYLNDEKNALFFQASDLQRPGQSALIQQMLKHQQYDISSRAELLIDLCRRKPEDVPAFS